MGHIGEKILQGATQIAENHTVTKKIRKSIPHPLF
jgi:hypothetical protein